MAKQSIGTVGKPSEAACAFSAAYPFLDLEVEPAKPLLDGGAVSRQRQLA